MDFTDFLDVLEGDVFEEKPVTVEEFVTSDKYLGLPPLSEHQYTMLKASTQIYKKETLVQLYGEENGEKRWKQTCNEVIFQLGKGSGKDYISTIACAYIVYLLLCLHDPAKYYGKPPGDSIDIINIAINAVQANRVFFKGFTTRIERSPWFQGRYHAKSTSIEFDKEVTVHSGHSQRESWEGYNVLVVILDEISGFDIESTSGNEQAKTAGAIYRMYKGSVDSRFPDYGKLILLSFPRYKNDFIQQRYNDVIAEKEMVIRSHEFKVDPDLPDDVEENKFSIEWEEDHIIAYNTPKVFALKRPTWEVNPTRSIEDFTIAFYKDSVDALSRFACMPPDAVDAFFKSREKIELAFNNPNYAVDESGRFAEWFVPDDEKRYFIHVDLAQKHDHCAVALSHVESWVQMKIADKITEAAPKVIIDAVRWWTPTSDKSVDFSEVKDYILQLQQRGFHLKLVTFDRWNSFDLMNELKAYGINTEILSVAKKHYDDFAMVVTEERVHGPRIDLLVEELLQLRIIKGKVDHPRKGSKDLADAVCGAIYNSIAHSPRDLNREIEIYTYSSMVEDRVETTIMERPGAIPRKRQMPEDLGQALSRIQTI